MTAFVLPARQLFLMVVDCPATICTNVPYLASLKILARSRGDVVGHFGPVLRIELRAAVYKTAALPLSDTGLRRGSTKYPTPQRLWGLTYMRCPGRIRTYDLVLNRHPLCR